MAVHVSIQPGYDPSYPWKQIGTGTGVAAALGLEYYLAPADKGGEPPGRWHGRGAAMLGFAEGQIIERAVFEKLYGDRHLDPRDPTDNTRLGRKPQQFASADDIFARLAAAEPQASPGRLAELRSLARAQTRRAVPYWDVTISISKSISLFYGSLLAKAERARQQGNMAEARRFAADAADLWPIVARARETGMAWLEDQAGYVRTGYHRGSGAESRAELGKWQHAGDWVRASFAQHTSRAGDPQLHEHNLVLNLVPGRDRREMAQAGLQGPVPAQGGVLRDRGRGARADADRPVRCGVGAAESTGTAGRSPACRTKRSRSFPPAARPSPPKRPR